MNPYQSYRLHITPLSPVHIGSGQSYEPTNYVIEDGILHEFDTGSVIDAFDAKDREGLLAIANRKPNADMIKALQLYFHERRELLKPWAINAIPVLQGVANLYAKNIGQTAQREAGGEEVLNRLEIDRCAYDPISRKPVLYGSAMKGAIRTALLDQLNNAEPLLPRDLDMFRLDDLPEYEQKKRKREQKRIFPRLNERLLGFRAGKFELDPLRLLHVSDASWQKIDDLPAAQVHLAVNRKKECVRDKNGNEIRSQAEKQDLYQILECLPALRYRAFSAQLNLHRLSGLNEHHAAEHRLPDRQLRFSMDEIAKRCTEFYLPVLKSEMNRMKDRGFLDVPWEKSIQQLLATGSEPQMSGSAFLLRVGRHSGAESVTLRGVRNIRIMKGTPEFQASAKTLWLAADTKNQQSNLLPFGWVLVEIQPWDQPVQEWPELQALCEPHLEQARAFAVRLSQQRERMEQARAATTARRQAAEDQARLNAERERMAAEQRAAMSVNQLAILNLRESMTPANKGKGPGAQLFSQVRDLIKQAEAWPESERAELRHAATETLAWLAVNKQKTKEVLRALASGT